jgi:hypothetical protein
LVVDGAVASLLEEVDIAGGIEDGAEGSRRTRYDKLESRESLESVR